MNYGSNIKIKLKDGTEDILHNITEIHYNYGSVNGEKRIAFESDIFATGITMFIKDIEEFETELASKKEKEF